MILSKLFVTLIIAMNLTYPLLNGSYFDTCKSPKLKDFMEGVEIKL
ncbi:hypothetical protein DOT_5751 [Desulfosporosinus sp. OT]|nr:hypothetical protein DOT_5751 [Desulfosporosinus sp. OT]